MGRGDMIIETIKIGFVNVYLITGSNGTIMIDTGYSQNKEVLYEKVKGRNIKLIILTHGHIDHIGGAYYLSRKLNAPIGMCEEDLELLKDNSSRALYADTLIGKILRGVSRKRFRKSHYEDIKVDLSLKEGMILNYGDLECRIIELPGHTRGSIGVVIKNNIFVGDAMMNIVKPTKARLYETLADVINSQKKILLEQVEYIYTGHGPRFSKSQFK